MYTAGESGLFWSGANAVDGDQVQLGSRLRETIGHRLGLPCSRSPEEPVQFAQHKFGGDLVHASIEVARCEIRPSQQGALIRRIRSVTL